MSRFGAEIRNGVGGWIALSDDDPRLVLVMSYPDACDRLEHGSTVEIIHDGQRSEIRFVLRAVQRQESGHGNT